MWALFFKKEFKGFWQRQSNAKDWLNRTCGSLGLNKNYIEVYECPAQRTDASYMFEEIDGTMNLVTFTKSVTTISLPIEEGEEPQFKDITKIVTNEPIPLDRADI